MDLTPSPGETPLPTWTPVQACTLPTADQPLRMAQFDDLFRAHLHKVERGSAAPATAARLLLTGDGGLPAKVRELTAAESACCSFFTFTINAPSSSNDQATVTLDITVPPEHGDVLAALVNRAELTMAGGA